ncbi:MAG: DUF6067 family protein [Thermoguttaceae bacterium]|nr:DUF6067 family protein [Thermoguttaceae bacterium]
MQRLLPLALAAVAGIPACPALADEKPFGLTVLHSMERILQHEPPFGAPVAEIAAGRNEVESFQVVVAALTTNLRVTGAELTELVGDGDARIPADCIKLYRQEYVRVRMSTPRAELPPGLYPDALVPFINPITGEPIQPLTQRRERWGEPLVTIGHDMYAVPFEVFKGQNQPLWVDVHVPKDVPAGVYRGMFRVSTDHGRAEVPVTLTVWDFTLPDGPTHSNHFGGFRQIAQYFGVKPGSDEFREIEAHYCRAMADHRINPPLPSHLLPEANPDGSLNIDPERHEALRKFMAELNVTDFEIPRSPFGRLPHSTTGPEYKTIPPEQREKAVRYYRDYYEYLKANGWAERAYIYLLDEPNTPENYEQVLVLAEVVREAAPELRILVVEQTYPHDPSWADIDPAIDIWCPLWAFIDRETINQKLAQGDSVWSYTALVQRAPSYHPQYEELREKDPPYWHIDRPLLVYRIPAWINRQYGITGLLYWSTVTRVIEPWFNPAFAHPRHFNGGGYLFYPGVPCGIDGPVASMRLKNLRDGMEDYEYFALLEQRGGAEAAQKVVNRIAPTWWEYTRDPQALLDARRELAEAIVGK